MPMHIFIYAFLFFDPTLGIAFFPSVPVDRTVGMDYQIDQLQLCKPLDNVLVHPKNFKDSKCTQFHVQKQISVKLVELSKIFL